MALPNHENTMLRIFKIFKYISLFSFTLLLSACFQSGTADHWIDNPTDKDIIITIDGTNITVPATSGINYTFEYGNHTLVYKKQTINFIVKPNKTFGFINPTRSNYVFYKYIYMDKNDPRATEQFLDWLTTQTASETDIIINDTLITQKLPFKIINDLFIEKSDYIWDYYLDDPIPEILILKDVLITRRNRSLQNDLNYKARRFQSVKSKIFRENDFINYLKESGIKENISFPKKPFTFKDLPKIEMVNINLDAIACPPGREAVKTALAHWNKWIKLKGSTFASEYNNFISRLGFDVLTTELRGQCYELYNKDYTYTQASTKILSVTFKLSDKNFFIEE